MEFTSIENTHPNSWRIIGHPATQMQWLALVSVWQARQAGVI